MLSTVSGDVTLTIGSTAWADGKGGLPAPNLGDLTCVAFYGVLLSGRRFAANLTATPMPDLSFEEALQANGEWIAIFQGRRLKSDYVVLTDAFGFQPLFYSSFRVKGDPWLTVGSSARGVAFERRAHGAQFNADWAQIACTLATNDAWANTLVSDRTPELSTRVMRPFQMLVVSEGQAAVVERAGIADLRQLDYEALLDRGIQDAGAQLKTLGKTEFPTRRINLSGGKDSRIMMALLRAANVEKEFQVRSVNPRKWPAVEARAGLERDLLLADTMRRRYGMEWAIESGYTADVLGPFEPLDAWQNLSGSINYRFRLNRTRRVRNELVAELRGASGETFREFWSYYWRRLSGFDEIGGTASDFERDAGILFESIYETDLVDPSMTEDMFEHFLYSLRSTGGEDVLDAGDRHFTLYRNRAHFGTTKRFAEEGAVPFFPLNQTAFVLAGELTDPIDRRNGAIFFDIIERLAPELNDLPFDSNQWSEEIRSRRTSGSRYNWDVTASMDDLPDYFENEERTAVSVGAAETAGSKAHRIITDTKPYVLAQTRAVVDELLTLEGASHVLTPKHVASLMSLPERNLGFAQTQLGKLVSIRDMVVGAKATVRLRAGAADGSTASAGALTLAGASVPPHFRRDLSTLLFRTAIRREGQQVIAETLVDHSEGHDLEFAFYLRTEGAVIEQRGYTAERVAHFIVPESDRDLHVQAFVRYARRPGQVFILQSVRIR